MISETRFEILHSSVIIRFSEEEGVSFVSALDTLYYEFKKLNGNEAEFSQLLMEWGLRS